MQFRSLFIWKRAVGFHLIHSMSLLAVLPMLCFPVVGDALNSLLIQQKVHGAGIFPWIAVRNVWSLAPRLFVMKVYFESIGLFWSLVPIYGILPAIKHRLYWAMASNVIVFEGLSGQPGRDRCRELIENFSGGLAVRTLITVPALLFTAFVIIWLITGTIYEVAYSCGFWTLIFLIFWVAFPVSGAVNTFLYLEMVKSQQDGTSRT
jgi:hypothetical protein